MRILIDISHPAHVHLFKNMIWKLENDGHEVKIAAKDRGIIFKLLDTYGFAHEKVDRDRNSLRSKAVGLVTREFKILKMVREFKPDISVGMGPIPLAHVSKLFKKPCISFTDTEHDRFERLLSDPFVTTICTPSCFKKDLGKKQVRYNGYHELAYLHPNYFKPDLGVLDDEGLNRNDKFVIIRLISWSALHDTHSKGISSDLLEKAIRSFEEYGHVFITSERKVDKNFEKYRITIPPEKLHSALYYARLYFGEGGTTAVEAALLGTPAVHVEAFKIKSGKVVDATQVHGNFDELVNRYRMLNTFADPNQAFNKALDILQDKSAKKDIEKRRERLLKEKIDVTAFMTDLIENYPQSFYTYQNKRGHNYV